MKLKNENSTDFSSMHCKLFQSAALCHLHEIKLLLSSIEKLLFQKHATLLPADKLVYQMMFVMHRQCLYLNVYCPSVTLHVN